MLQHQETVRLTVLLQRRLPQAIGWTGIGYRSASTPYASATDLLTGIGSQRSGGRWNPLGSFPTVYLSLELDTAFRESFAHFSYYGFEPYEGLPRTFVAVQLQLQRLLDLTDSHVLKRLRLSRRSLLHVDWRKVQDTGKEALTQAIGRTAQEVGYEGILVPSAAARGGLNLVYFPDCLLPGSKTEVLNSGKLKTIH